MSIKFNKNQLQFITVATQKYGTNAILNRDQIAQICEENAISFPHWFVAKKDYRGNARGEYVLPVTSDDEVTIPNNVEVNSSNESVMNMSQVLAFKQPKMVDESDPAIPNKYPDYVPFGFYKDLNNIIKSKMFYPVFITGLSGNGKTLMIEQICAEQKRECIRVNISIETDETDLLGGPTLINGNIVNRDGPVITAMKRGAILLIDEVDRGSSKLMCIQGILEGKPYYNKKNGEVVHPANGFNIVATANTKGQGNDDGRYLAQILDGAFLERFPITVEQEFPDSKTETKILLPLIEDKEFVKNLVKWADVIRQSFEQGAVDEVISTRRLVHIAKAYNIFKDRMKAIELCVARYDTETKMAFMDLYSKVDAEVESPINAANTVTRATTEEIPF